MSVQAPGCSLCDTGGGAVVWRNDRLRVVHAHEAGFPAFYRVVWTDHAPEFSDLEAADKLDRIAHGYSFASGTKRQNELHLCGLKPGKT